MEPYPPPVRSDTAIISMLLQRHNSRAHLKRKYTGSCSSRWRTGIACDHNRDKQAGHYCIASSYLLSTTGIFGFYRSLVCWQTPLLDAGRNHLNIFFSCRGYPSSSGREACGVLVCRCSSRSCSRRSSYNSYNSSGNNNVVRCDKRTNAATSAPRGNGAATAFFPAGERCVHLSNTAMQCHLCDACVPSTLRNPFFSHVLTIIQPAYHVFRACSSCSSEIPGTRQILL